MPELHVADAAAASIQGLGRYGAQRYGIAPGGAMDRLALAEANALASQTSGAAAIEIGPLPARFTVADGTIRCAVTGAQREVFLNDRQIPLGLTFRASDRDAIVIRGASAGQYSYLSIEGGLQGASGNHRDRNGPDASRSWHLQTGDTLSLRAALQSQAERRLRLHKYTQAPIRVVLGPQLDFFSTKSVAQFLATPWAVSHAANRMAYLLEGGRIIPEHGYNIVSDGTVSGNIQIAGSGQPYVILSDRGTVGGYPKIATIISADLGRFAQLSPGERFHFVAVSVLEAQIVARTYTELLNIIKTRLEIVQPVGISMAALSNSNLAGDVVDALATINEPLEHGLDIHAEAMR